jgi:hypothetical protein
MTTLHDRLADLANEAPSGAPAPDLWAHGRRVHRRRLAGTVVIVAVTVLALGILGTTSWLRTRQEPLPAAPTQGMRLPDHLYAPSRWLPGTNDEGPLGPLSAIVLGQGGVTGVSASTGEYRRLDFPGSIGFSDTVGAFGLVDALSSDGSRVAYWYDLDGDQGVAVYDTLTGEIERRGLASKHGIEPNGLLFVGDELWFDVQRYNDNEQDLTGHGPRVWDLGSGDVSAPRWPHLGLLQATAADGIVLPPPAQTVSFWTSDRRPTRRTADRLLTGPAVLAPDESRMGAVADPDGATVFTDRPGDLLVLRPGAPRELVSTAVPGVQAYSVLGWRDDQHLVVYSGSGDYRSVDIDSGQVAPLVHADLSNGNVLIAQDAWSAPTYDAPAPPNPIDPRITWGGGIGVVVAGVGMLLLWRRRVRA